MDFEHLALVGIVRQLRHDMSFIVGIIVIAVDNSDGIIQLQAVLKAPVRFWGNRHSTQSSSIRARIPVGILIVSPGFNTNATGAEKS